MDFHLPSNLIAALHKVQKMQLQQNQQKLVKTFHKGLKNQTVATAKMMKLAETQTTAQTVAAEQARPIVKDCFQKLSTGSKPAVATKAPAITPQQKIDMGTQALKATPEFTSAYTKITQAEHQLHQASKLEDKVLKAKAQQALETDLNMVVHKGEKFYDAYESPREIEMASQKYEKLLKPEYGNHILHSDRFKDAIDARYGSNPFEVTTKAKPLFGHSKPNPSPPRPIGYQSSKGWLYDEKTTAYLHSIDPKELSKWIKDEKTLAYFRKSYRPEDLSWIQPVQDRVIGNEQAALLQRPSFE